MPQYFVDKNWSDCLRVEPSASLGKRLWSQKFYVGERIAFNLKVSPLNETGKQRMESNFRLFEKLPQDEWKEVPLSIYDPNNHQKYIGKTLTRTGEVEYKLAQGTSSEDWFIPVMSAVVYHPDEKSTQLNLVFIAFLLSLLGSICEVLTAVYIWLHPFVK